MLRQDLGRKGLVGVLGFLEKGVWLWGFWEERPSCPLLTQGPMAAHTHPLQPWARRGGEQLAPQGLLPPPRPSAGS